jgi:hypothetical protein
MIGVFALSAILGLAFLMHGVSLLNEKQSFDIYASSLRVLAALQIILVLVGVVLLAPILCSRPARKASAGPAIQISVDADQTLSYPVDPDKNVTIEFDGGKVTFSATKQP